MCSHFAKPKRTLPKRVLPNHATVFTVAGGETRNNWSMIKEVRLGISEQPLRAGRQVNEHCGNNTQSYDGRFFDMYALTDKFMQPSTQNCPYFFLLIRTIHRRKKGLARWRCARGLSNSDGPSMTVHRLVTRGVASWRATHNHEARRGKIRCFTSFVGFG